MRGMLVVFGLLCALALPVAATAAALEQGAGSSCPAGTVGTWKFVNNKTDGAPAGTLTAFFALEEFPIPGGTQFNTGPIKPNKNAQTFVLYTNGAATLLSASTNLPGKLILESVTCGPFA